MQRPRKSVHSRDVPRDSPGHPLLLEDCKIWTENGFTQGSVLISHGKIQKIARRISKDGVEALRCKGLIALPGMIDVHVHLRGLDFSYKEDFQSGTTAAIAGGVTSVLDMPNTKPVTDTPERLREKAERARSKILANVGFHAAAVPDARAIKEMARLGAFSLKLYMPRPISPIDVDDDKVLLRLCRSSRQSDIPITVHAEDRRLIDQSRTRPASFLQLADGRPDSAEKAAVERMIHLARQTGARIHFCHLTIPSSIQLVKKNRWFASSEVTPHHMLLGRNAILKEGWRAWMVPPLRRRESAKEIMKMVSNGSVSLIASDHAPHTIKEKSGPIYESPPGIPGLETCLPLMLTLVNRGLLTMSRLVQLYSTNPARTFGLGLRGKISRGYDADIVLVNTRKRGRIRGEDFWSKAHYSPFEGMTTRGRVETTIVSGSVVFRDGMVIGKPGDGNLLRPSASP